MVHVNIPTFIRTQKGSALYIVLIFSLVTLASSAIYVIHQMHFASLSRKDPARLQALLNARSGIWYGLALLDKEVDLKQSHVDSVDTAMTSALFGEDMFKSFDDMEDESREEESSETSLLSFNEPKLVSLMGDRITFTFYLQPSSYFRILESTGHYRDFDEKVITTIASRPFTSPDTVLFLQTHGKPEGFGIIDGRVSFCAQSIDSSDSLERKRFYVDKDEVRCIVDEFQKPLVTLGDSVLPEAPLTILYNDDFAEIPDTVYGSLFIDGSSRDLQWNTKRTIYVLEELQLTGDIVIQGVTFVVKGDIKILDNTALNSVELFTASRIFFAGESRFQGNALACSDVEIYEQAVISGKSIIIVAGLDKKAASPVIKTQNESQGNAPINKVTLAAEKKIQQKKAQEAGKKKKKEKKYSLFIRDQAIVDGVIINLSPKYGISTDVETIIRGVLWAEGRVCHRGRMKGVIKAKVLVDEADPKNNSSNMLTGTIKELESIKSYYLPYFIGVPVLIEWKEL